MFGYFQNWFKKECFGCCTIINKIIGLVNTTLLNSEVYTLKFYFIFELRRIATLVCDIEEVNNNLKLKLSRIPEKNELCVLK